MAAPITATPLYTAATGNVDSAVATVTDFLSPGAIVVTSTVGATPTVTLNIKGSADGVNYFNIPYALVATPTTFVVTAITITTATTTTYLLQSNQPWQFVRLSMTANTNVTLSATAYL